MIEQNGGDKELLRATRLAEQLHGHPDFYAQTVGGSLSYIVNPPYTQEGVLSGTGIGDGLSQNEEARWEQIQLAIFSIGVHDRDSLLANDALTLLKRPSNKWRAVVWALKQGNPLAIAEWLGALGAADEEAAQSTPEAFEVGLAKLDWATYQPNKTPKDLLADQRQKIDEIIAGNEYLLKDGITYNTPEKIAQQRLRMARILRDAGDFKRAKQLRFQSQAAPKEELKAFDKYLEQQKDLGPGWFGLRRPRLTGPTPNLIDIDSPVDDFLRTYYPEQAAARGHRIGDPMYGDERLVSSLDTLLRANKLNRARKCFEDILLGKDNFIHLGMRAQAAVLLYRFGIDDRFQDTMAKADVSIGQLANSQPESIHSTTVEQMNASLEHMKRLQSTFESVNKLPNLRERATRLLRLREILGALSIADSSKIDLGREVDSSLQRAWTMWGRALPNDAKREALVDRAIGIGVKVRCKTIDPCGGVMCKVLCTPRDRMAGLGLIPQR